MVASLSCCGRSLCYDDDDDKHKVLKLGVTFLIHLLTCGAELSCPVVPSLQYPKFLKLVVDIHLAAVLRLFSGA